MKISYDSEVDVLYIQFLETTVSTQALAEGIAAAGIEILDALKRFGDPNILRRIVLEDIGLIRA
jgi:uncharacterized protein YuzE